MWIRREQCTEFKGNLVAEASDLNLQGFPGELVLQETGQRFTRERQPFYSGEELGGYYYHAVDGTKLTVFND